MNERYTFTPTIVRDLIAVWLEVADGARKTKRYRLSAREAYRRSRRR